MSINYNRKSCLLSIQGYRKVKVDEKEKGKLGERLTLFVLFIFVIAAFVQFSGESKERIIRQNQNYVVDAAVQVAARVDDVLAGARENIDTAAYMCELMMDSPEVSPELLKRMKEGTSFDYLEFVNKDGVNVTAEGQTADVSDREYYIEGMKGNSGIFVTDHSRITDELLVTFYMPLHYDGEVVGVLNGIFRKTGMSGIIGAKFFGIQAKSYLCMKDGTVIASTGDDLVPENMLELPPGLLSMDEEQFEEFQHAFQYHENYSYRYDGSQGPGNACLIGLSQSDWMLLLTFPSKVTDRMIDDVNQAGVHLVSMLILVFGLYIVYLIIRNYRQKKQLVSEKQEFSRIIEGITQLFSRFLVIDLEADRYEYLNNTQGDWKKSGTYSELVQYLAPRYVSVECGESMGNVITRAYIQEHLTESVPYLQFEYQIQCRDGKLAWENISIFSLQRKDGVPSSVLFAIQDVTALKEAELQNRIALKEAFQAADEASHAKSDFLSRMSHDIRTPMNGIMGMTAVALMHIDDKERLTDCLNKISLSSNHLLALINDVLDMSKIESGKMTLTEEPLDLQELTDSLLAIMGPQIQEKKQTLRTDISGIVHKKVMGDSLRLQQVFVNIMGNAVKFTPEGGTISFRVSELPSRAAGSGCYEFVFEDTGIGMSRDFVDKIFEPFSRAQQSSVSNTEGTGLGMAITRNIVRLMNGDIQVESEPGKGSRFTVMLYLKLQEGAESREPDPESRGDGSDLENMMGLRCSGRRALLVEDNEINMEIAGELLGMTGIQVDKVYDGQQAVDTLLEKPEHYYDVVFMDIRMPVKNGYEAAKEIRSSGREDLAAIPIIAMSADAFSDDISRAKASGMNDHIAKPVELAKLAAALEKWIGKGDQTKPL